MHILYVILQVIYIIIHSSCGSCGCKIWLWRPRLIFEQGCTCVNFFCMYCMFWHINTVDNGDWLAFGASPKWSFSKLQFCIDDSSVNWMLTLRQARPEPVASQVIFMLAAFQLAQRCFGHKLTWVSVNTATHRCAPEQRASGVVHFWSERFTTLSPPNFFKEASVVHGREYIVDYQRACKHGKSQVTLIPICFVYRLLACLEWYKQII